MQYIKLFEEYNSNIIEANELKEEVKSDIANMLSVKFSFFNNVNYFWNNDSIKEFVFDTPNLTVELRKENPKKLYNQFNNRYTSPIAVKVYVEMIENGIEFDPVLVVGDEFLDGGHRVEAYVKANKKEIPVVDIENIWNYDWKKETIKTFGKDVLNESKSINYIKINDIKIEKEMVLADSTFDILKYYDKDMMPLDKKRVLTMKKKLLNGEKLPPVIIDKENNLKDGHHRYYAYKLAKKDEIPFEYKDGINENKNIKFLTLYHGTCKYNAEHLIKNGWKPSKYNSGGNMGQNKYLYLTTHPEDARWFANEKGCDTIVKIENIPVEYLIPDPEDEAGFTMTELLNKLNKSKLPTKFALTKQLDGEHFSVL